LLGETSLSLILRVKRVSVGICHLGCPVMAGLSGPGKMPNNGHAKRTSSSVFNL